MNSAERHAAWRRRPGAKSKLQATQKRFHARNPEYKAFAHIEKRYGLTRAQYAALLELQGGRCAICRRGPEGSGKKRLTVDHDHRTGEVRGLLCNLCNVSLGSLRDDVQTARSLIVYLESEHVDVGIAKQLF